MSCSVRNAPRGSHHSAARDANFASSLESTFAMLSLRAQLSAPALGRRADLGDVEPQQAPVGDELLAGDPDVGHVVP